MKKFKFKINGNEYEVSVNEIEKNVAEIEVNGTPFTVEIAREEKVQSVALMRNKTEKVESNVSKNVAIKAQLPGNIFKILVSEGQSVKKGDVLLIMESMKMENNIVAENDGVVKKICVELGQSVLQDDLLIEFASMAVIQSAVAPKAATNTAPKTAFPAAPKSVSGSNTICSPLPGSVFKIVVQEGVPVQKGDVLLILESMKMENNILADRDGIVKAYHVTEGQSIMQDDPLVDLA